MSEAASAPDRVLARVMFTDIVGSTEPAEKGRRPAVGAPSSTGTTTRMRRESVERHDGREVKTTGDGIFAAFDGPARTVQATGPPLGSGPASRARAPRAGVHTGEVRAARRGHRRLRRSHRGRGSAALAAADEVLVSRTVTDLVAGSGLEFRRSGVRTT